MYMCFQGEPSLTEMLDIKEEADQGYPDYKGIPWLVDVCLLSDYVCFDNDIGVHTEASSNEEDLLKLVLDVGGHNDEDGETIDNCDQPKNTHCNGLCASTLSS